MAITVNSVPSGSQSVQDDMWHIVSSSNSGTTDFKYIFDIWINGTQKIRVKQYPEPSSGKAYFDAGPTVRNSMTYAWFEPVSNAYVSEPDMSGQVGIVYNIRYGEEVTGTSTFNLVSGDVSAYNWCPPLFRRKSISLADKLNKWLTNRPLIAKTTLSERLYAGFYTSANNSLKLYCNTYDQSNSLITAASGTTNVIENGFVQMNIGTTALASLLSMTFLDNVKYYDVWFNTYEKMRVYPIFNNKYTPYRLHFLNRWGLYDTQTFDLVSKLTMDVERKTFGQKDYRFNGNSVDYYSTSNRYYEGKINNSNIANWTYKLTADAMTDDEYIWMADLITSPQILFEYDGFFYPITIKNSNYEYSKFENNKLKALDIEIEMNQQRRTQLR